MRLLEALISFWFFLLLLAAVHWSKSSADLALYRAVLEEDANYIALHLGVGAKAELRAEGVCFQQDPDGYIRKVHFC